MDNHLYPDLARLTVRRPTASYLFVCTILQQTFIEAYDIGIQMWLFSSSSSTSPAGHPEYLATMLTIPQAIGRQNWYLQLYWMLRTALLDCLVLASNLPAGKNCKVEQLYFCLSIIRNFQETLSPSIMRSFLCIPASKEFLYQHKPYNLPCPCSLQGWLISILLIPWAKRYWECTSLFGWKAVLIMHFGDDQAERGLMEKV